MAFKRRVFFTSPTDKFLDADGRDIKKRILQKIRDADYEPQLFFVRGFLRTRHGASATFVRLYKDVLVL